jgi:hypothetical protein
VQGTVHKVFGGEEVCLGVMPGYKGKIIKVLYRGRGSKIMLLNLWMALWLLAIPFLGLVRFAIEKITFLTGAYFFS